MNIDRLLALYNKIQDAGIFILDYPQKDTKAVTIKNQWGYGIFIDAERMETTAEELSILAHEYGHCSTGATHAVSSPLDLIEKHEYKADKWAVHHLIPPEEYKAAIADGYTEVWQLAEQFGVTEELIRRADYIYRCEGLLE